MATERHASGLPTRFALGTVYVIEGRGGEYGHLRISARYVVTPSGQRIDVMPRLERLRVVRGRGRRPALDHGCGQKRMPKPPKGAPKEISPSAKNLRSRQEPTREGHVSR